MSATRPISLSAFVQPGASTCHDRRGRCAGFFWPAEAGWAAVRNDAATAAVRAAHRTSGVRDGEGKPPGTVQILRVGCRIRRLQLQNVQAALAIYTRPS